jgi:hypothetical protein
MLLRLLYDLAHSPSRHILADLAFAPKPVRWIIELDANGRVLGDGPQPTGDDKRGKEFSCPQTTRSKVAGGNGGKINRCCRVLSRWSHSCLWARHGPRG